MYVEIYQNISEYIKIYQIILKCQNISEYSWIYQNIVEYIRIYLNLSGYIRIYQNISEYIRMPQYIRICPFLFVHTCCSVPGTRTGASFNHAMPRTGMFIWLPCRGLGNHLLRTGQSPAADWGITCRGLGHLLPRTGHHTWPLLSHA